MKTLSLLLSGFILACSQGESSDVYAETAAYRIYNHTDEAMTVSIDYDGSPERTSALPQQQQEQKIIQTAHLRFETKDLDKTHQKIQRLVSENQGFIQNDNAGKSYRDVYREMTVRIPTTHFQQTIDSISDGISFFDQKSISRKDVTEEFVDLNARLKAKKELETRYLELLKQAKNVKEMLEIERELSKIREEIEARQGRLNYLENQVSFSTVSIYFYKTTAENIGVTTSYGTKMWNAVKSGWNGISIFFLGLIHIWPFIVLLLIGIYLLRRYLKKKKHQKKL